MATTEQIQEEIKRLREMKPRVRQRTSFGDDNWVAIDAQIRVLKDNLTDDDIYDIWPDDNEDYVRGIALDTLEWMDDKPESESPSSGWSDLLYPD